MLQTQSIARMTAHGGVDGGRSQGVHVADVIHGTPEGDRADVRGSQRNDGELMESSNTAGTEDLGGAAVTSIRGGAWVPEDWGGASVTDDWGGGVGKKEPAQAIWVERRRTVEGSQVRGIGRVTTDQGGARGMREPSGAIRPRVSGGAEGGRSQGRADRSMGRGGGKGSEAGGGAKGSTRLGEAGGCMTWSCIHTSSDFCRCMSPRAGDEVASGRSHYWLPWRN